MVVSEGLTAEEQRARSEWFRAQWEKGVAFNRYCGMRRWASEGVEFLLPYADTLSAHDGIFHGGVVAALLDTTGGAAVMAGHDFSRGSRLATVSLSVQYLTVAPGEDLMCQARCTRRGRTISFAEAAARGVSSGKLVATGQVAVSIIGERPGAPWLARASR
jgi:uncharacterized protein (TIGR00369 family)